MISHLNVYVIHPNRSKDLDEIRKNYYICYNNEQFPFVFQMKFGNRVLTKKQLKPKYH